MYDENFVEKLCDYYNLNCLYKYRFHKRKNYISP